MMKDKEKAHGVQLLIRAVVKNSDGKILSDTGQKPAKSFVKQFLAAIGDLFDSTDTNTWKSITGSTGAVIFFSGGPFTEPYFRLGAPAYESLYGIVVGTGDTAVDNEDYSLETQLTEGAGAGNITHGAMEMSATAIVGPNVDTEHGRTFTNNTGSAILVKEAGVYIRSGILVDSRMFCIIRDVLAPAINVPDKCSMTIYYTFRTTV